VSAKRALEFPQRDQRPIGAKSIEPIAAKVDTAGFDRNTIEREQPGLGTVGGDDVAAQPAIGSHDAEAWAVAGVVVVEHLLTHPTRRRTTVAERFGQCGVSADAPARDLREQVVEFGLEVGGISDAIPGIVEMCGSVHTAIVENQTKKCRRARVRAGGILGPRIGRLWRHPLPGVAA
jgi:hypothetical protein